MERGETVLDPRLLEADCAARAVGHDRWFAALKVLQANRLLTVAWVAPSLVTHVELTAKGLDRALARARPDMAEVRARLVAELGRRRPGAVVRLDQALAEPPLLIDVLLDHLRAEGLADCTRVPGGGVRIGALAGLSTRVRAGAGPSTRRPRPGAGRSAAGPRGRGTRSAL
jgi:hypothetical protein